MEGNKRIEEFVKIAYNNNIRGEINKETFFQEPLNNENIEDIKKADELLLDIVNTPHAFVLGCVMDMQIQAEKAWIIPYKVINAFLKMGLIKDNSIENMAIVHLEKYKEVFLNYYGRSLHRFDYMSERFYKAVLHIKNKYSGNASNIWIKKPSSKCVVDRFCEFDGIGQKISTMATNILFRKFGIEFSELSCIDISLDIHIIRVMKRLGLIKYDGNEKLFKENILKETRYWNPKYPGVFDRVCFYVGRNWCHENKIPECKKCILNEICRKQY